MLKSYFLNILSLCNVFLGFFFVLMIGNKLGVGDHTDIYFGSLVFIAYVNILIQAMWEAVKPYYISKKNELDSSGLNDIYVTLVIIIVIISTAIILTYNIFVLFFTNDLYTDYVDFFNVIIWIIPFQNLIIFNKTILNLEEKYESYYLADIFVYSVGVLAIYFLDKPTIYTIAYFSIGASIMVSFFQLYYMMRIRSFNFSFSIYSVKDIIINSAKLKFGALFYSLKDPILAAYLNSMGSGVFTIYSYANKFASAVFMIVNAPVVNVYVTKINNLVATGYLSIKVRKVIRSLLYKTVSLFVLSSTAVYFLIPYLLTYFSSEWQDRSSIFELQSMFFLVAIYYFIMVLESPFSKLAAAHKFFNYSMIVNINFSIVFVLGYYVVLHFNLEYNAMLLVLIAAQLCNMLLFSYKCYSEQKL